jgi:excisionase family DNA binding protein
MARSLVTLTQAERERPWATRRYLRRLIAEKRIGYFKPGGTILVDLDELDAWAEAGRVEKAGA